MTKIPYTKAHGAKNDFLLTWKSESPKATAEIAVAICDRHTGVGADGWMLVDPGDAESDGAIELLNSDGSTAEISGNGTRCAAAFLIQNEAAENEVRIRTGAGIKHLRVLERAGLLFQFEMNMGRVRVEEERSKLRLSSGDRDVTLLWVGNPQCAVPVENFDFDWRSMGAEIERHHHFPNRTNVSFVRRVDDHTIEARFFERGAGETMSSGTGSTGAVAMALERGWVDSPVTILTPAGSMELRLEKGELFLRGPAEIVATGEYLWKG